MANETELSTAAQSYTAQLIDDHRASSPHYDISNVYRTVLDEVERPMLEVLMRYTHGNQSRAAECLGINRATLRTKLRRHNLL